MTFVPADRDRDAGLTPVTGQQWDAVIDVARQPGHVRRTIRDLRAKHWVFVSSGSVYARFDRLEQDESSGLLEPLSGDVMPDMSAYGPAKVACEEAVRGPTSAAIIRAGLIGGPGDPSGRTGYYLSRLALSHAPDVLVPPDWDFPCAVIDVDDLAAWIVEVAGRRLEGTFNATGPTTTLGKFLATARQVVGGGPPWRSVPTSILRAEGVTSWMGPKSLPLWIDDPEWRFFATMDTTAARAEGLITRPLAETLTRTLAYERARDVPMATGLSEVEEQALRDRISNQQASPV